MTDEPLVTHPALSAGAAWDRAVRATIALSAACCFSDRCRQMNNLGSTDRAHPRTPGTPARRYLETQLVLTQSLTACPNYLGWGMKEVFPSLQVWGRMATPFMNAAASARVALRFGQNWVALQPETTWKSVSQTTLDS